MKLSNQQNSWIRKNEVMITSILENRIDDLKDALLEAPEEKRSNVIAFIKEYKAGLGLLKELDKVKQPEDLTGI